MKIKLLILLIFLVCIPACNILTPSCSDSETKELVLQVVKDNWTNMSGKNLNRLKKLELDIIRTTSINKDIGSSTCAANLNFTVDNEEHTIPITYSCGSTDKFDEIYVEVDGLWRLIFF